MRFHWYYCFNAGCIVGLCWGFVTATFPHACIECIAFSKHTATHIALSLCLSLSISERLSVGFIFVYPILGTLFHLVLPQILNCLPLLNLSWTSLLSTFSQWDRWHITLSDHLPIDWHILRTMKESVFMFAQSNRFSSFMLVANCINTAYRFSNTWCFLFYIILLCPITWGLQFC